jgi:hypothetical protein
MIEAKIIKDSISPNGIRLTSFQLKYHRWILGEFNTHRVFSRSTSSSRAIPIFKIIKEVWNNPAKPVYWGKNISGMQAKEELTGIKLFGVKVLWRLSSKVVCLFALLFYYLGLHKQVGNRILEPWVWANTIVTTTELDNFFELRNHPDAQPEFKRLAELMLEVLNESTPKMLNYGEWHLPYVTDEELKEYGLDNCLKISTARCARVSYNNHDGSRTSPQRDYKLHDDLVMTIPKHASPSEHQATPSEEQWCKNFRGWMQYRTLVEQM